MTSIGKEAFKSNNSNLKSLKIPNSVLKIGESAFERVKSKSLEIGKNVTIIDNSAFNNSKITSINFLEPSSLEIIYRRAFSGNELKKVTIPNSVTFIDEFSFAENALTEVKISNSIKIIPFGSFYNNNLTSVTIPKSVTYIGKRSFSNNELKEVIIKNSEENITIDNAFDKNVNIKYEPSANFLGEISKNDKVLNMIYKPNQIKTFFRSNLKKISNNKIGDIDDQTKFYLFDDKFVYENLKQTKDKFIKKIEIDISKIDKCPTTCMRNVYIFDASSSFGENHSVLKQPESLLKILEIMSLILKIN